MIDLIFFRGPEIAFVSINGHSIGFANSLSGDKFSSFKGLKLNKEGCLREFPDLKGREDWKEEVNKRFNKKIKKMKTEEEICQYITVELSKQGYRLKKKQRAGFRPEVIRWMAAIDSLITIAVLLALFILAYCRITNRSLGEIITDIRDAMSSTTEEVGVDF